MRDQWLVYWPDGMLVHGEVCFSAQQAYWQAIYFSRSKWGKVLSVFMMTGGFTSPFLDRRYQYGKLYQPPRTMVVDLAALGVSAA